MTTGPLLFLFLSGALLVLLPRRWAPLALLVGACYMPSGLYIQVGPFHFTLIRILLAIGLLRVIARGEWLEGQANDLDRIILIWAAWALISSVFHQDPRSALTFRLGLVYNSCLIYFLFRIFLQTLEDIAFIIQLIAVVLIPVALEMILEHLTLHNYFATFGGLREIPDMRLNRVRAQGPFAHSILAGTVGGTNLPLIIGVWTLHRNQVIIGVLACLIMVFASTSSGPIVTTFLGLGAIVMWPWRERMRLFRRLAIACYILLEIVMKAPAYYLIARVDLTGGSTGWHRARLIETSIEHLNEWWLGGADNIRHWMETGVSWSADSVDITNHYLYLGVIGGLPLMILFIVTLVRAFSFLGQIQERLLESSHESRFLIWALGACLFAHACSFVSVAYFDQSYIFLYLVLAAVSSVYSDIVIHNNPDTIPTGDACERELAV